MLTREVFPDAEAGDSDYRLAERFFDRYEGDWFKIDRRDGSPWVEPTPEACRRASLDTAGKHTVETQDSDGTADDTGQSEAEADARSFLRVPGEPSPPRRRTSSRYSATDARYTENGQTVLCDGGTADGQDPLAPIREHEEVIREKVVEGKDDDLVAWGRVLLALANDRQPDSDDLQRLELPGGPPEALLATA